MKKYDEKSGHSLQRKIVSKGAQLTPPRYGQSFVDERKKSPSQVVQRVPVGTGHGTDSDRNNIEVEDVHADEPIQVAGDNQGRARINALVVNGHNYANRVLKHYMVVRNNWRYQFPIKHAKAPRRRIVGGVRYSPNQGDVDQNRGGQPEGFGGNHDLAQGVNQNDTLYNTRRATLAREYPEENHNHGGANVNNIVASKKFGAAWGAGTLSIADSNHALPAHATNNLADNVNRGATEMAGTVSIDCADLIGRAEQGDALEHLISAKITAARNAFYNAHRGTHDPHDDRQIVDPFSTNAGILAHLVGMVAVDIEAERARRDALAAQQRRDAAAQQRMMFTVIALVVLLMGFGVTFGIQPIMDLFNGKGNKK